MYYIEGEAQSDKFPNILSSLWWAVVTLTTIGYGDVVPVTGWGRLLSGLVAVMGIGLVAVRPGSSAPASSRSLPSAARTAGTGRPSPGAASALTAVRPWRATTEPPGPRSTGQKAVSAP